MVRGSKTGLSLLHDSYLNCIKKLEFEKASGTLIIPEWKSAAYWPEMLKSNGLFKDFVKESMPLPTRNLIIKGPGNNGLFGKEQLSFRMIAFHVRFLIRSWVRRFVQKMSLTYV